MTDYTPTTDDKFSFGLWTVGWQGVDVFGGAVRPPLDPVEAVHRLAELGAYGGHLPRRRPVPVRRRPTPSGDASSAFTQGAGRDRPGASTDGHHQPVRRTRSSRTAAFTANDRDVRRFALRKVMRNIDLAAELGAKTYVLLGRPGGRRVRRRKDVRAALDRYKEALRPALRATSATRATTSGSPSSPSRTSRAATSCCPPIGHALAFINELEHPELVGLNPEVGHEEMAGLNFAHGIAQALWHGKLFHIDLNGQHGPRYDQDLRFGAGNAARRVLDRRRAGAAPAAYDGPCTSTTSRRAPRTTTGVWASARGLHAQLPDPAGEGRGRSAPTPRCRGRSRPRGSTSSPCRRWPRGVPGRPARRDVRPRGARRARAWPFERLDQLAMEHLLGVR